MDESVLKGHLVKNVRVDGGYARRLEDQFAVGIPDMLMVPAGGPVFLVEAKIIRSKGWGATERQALELSKFEAAGKGACFGVEVGYKQEGKELVLRWKDRTLVSTVATWKDLQFSQMLRRLVSG